jgi:DNA-directed RNA polymerase subunit RPC12/RpoP
MDFNYYCRHCGNKVEEIIDGDRIFRCECMNRTLNRNEVIPGWTRDARINQLRAMHNLMCEANDESIYMAWIYTMPDCPTEEDFIDIAMDDDSYNECFDAFIRLIAKNGNRW